MRPYCRRLLIATFCATALAVPQLAHAAECKPWNYWQNGQIIASFPDANGNLTTTINADIDEMGNPIPWCAVETIEVYFSGGGWKIDWAYKSDGLTGVSYPWFYADNYGNVNGVPNGFAQDFIPPIEGYTQLADDQDWIALKTKPIYVSGQKLGTKYENKPIVNTETPIVINKCANYVEPSENPGQCSVWSCDPATGQPKQYAAPNGLPCESTIAGTFGWTCGWGSCQGGQYIDEAYKPIKPQTLVAGKFFFCNLAGGKVTCSGKVPNPLTIGAATTFMNSGTIKLVDYIVSKAPLVQDAISLSATDTHVCALLKDTTVSCWGYLGDINTAGIADPYGAILADQDWLKGPAAVMGANGKPINSIAQIVTAPSYDLFLYTNGSLTSRGSLPYCENITEIMADGSKYMYCKKIPELSPFMLNKKVIQIAEGLTLFEDHTAQGFGSAGYSVQDEVFPASYLTDIASLKAGKDLYWMGLYKAGMGAQDPYAVPQASTDTAYAVSSDKLKQSKNCYYNCSQYSLDNILSVLWSSGVDANVGKLAITPKYACYLKGATTQPQCLKVVTSYNGTYFSSGDAVYSNPLDYNQPKVIPIDDIFTEIASSDSSTCVTVAGGQVKCWGENTFGEMGSFENVVGTPQCLDGKPGCFTNTGKTGIGIMYAAGGKLSCNFSKTDYNGQTVPAQYLGCDGTAVKLQYPSASCASGTTKPSCDFGSPQCTEGGLIQCNLNYMSSTYSPFCQEGQATCIKTPSESPYGTPSCSAGPSKVAGCVNMYGELQSKSQLVCSKGIPTCKLDQYYGGSYIAEDSDKEISCPSPSDPPKCVPLGTVTPAVCGNGKLESGEECDDGNIWSWDGCSGSCKKELAPSDPYNP